ncbi:hypothetical protein V6N12_020534 [Hibiscus sabdariffa]|uniref:Uncharacterized protein n=1 Tax=Hibiscus sabdariffa TaxID=183260 RepID=A0ABR2CYE4_9ROSI
MSVLNERTVKDPSLEPSKRTQSCSKELARKSLSFCISSFQIGPSRSNKFLRNEIFQVQFDETRTPNSAIVPFLLRDKAYRRGKLDFKDESPNQTSSQKEIFLSSPT